MNWYVIGAAAVVFIALLVYIIYMSVIKGPAQRPESRRALRKNGTELPHAVGAESTYTPSQGSSTAQPLPIHGKEEREPTSSFQDYKEGENPSKEE